MNSLPGSLLGWLVAFLPWHGHLACIQEAGGQAVLLGSNPMKAHALDAPEGAPPHYSTGGSHGKLGGVL